MSKPVTDVLVLLSGGQDSTTCLFWAKDQYPSARIHALTMHYGQRHEAEIAAAAKVAALARCATHHVVDLAHALSRSHSALLSVNASLPIKGDGGLADDKAPGGLPTSFVPGRNLVFLAVAAAHAGALGARHIVTGVCQTDYSGYPDCRAEFVAAMEHAVDEAMPSSLRPMIIEAPLMRLTKAETVRLAVDLAVRATARNNRDAWTESPLWQALGQSITCYHGMRPGCGACPACELRIKGFKDAGVEDPSAVAA